MQITTDQERNACNQMLDDMLADGTRLKALVTQALLGELSPEDQAEHDALMNEWVALQRAVREYDEGAVRR